MWNKGRNGSSPKSKFVKILNKTCFGKLYFEKSISGEESNGWKTQEYDRHVSVQGRSGIIVIPAKRQSGE